MMEKEFFFFCFLFCFLGFVAPSSVPSNDLCQNPSDLELGVRVEGTTVNGTHQPEIPPCHPGSYSAPEVFYSFKAKKKGFYKFSVCEQNDSLFLGGPFWPLVEAIGGTCDDPLCPPQSLLSCSQTRQGGISIIQLEEKETTTVVVYSNDSRSSGEFNITVSWMSAEELGLDCQSPIPIPGVNMTIQGQTLYVENGENILCNKTVKNEDHRTFFSFDPPYAGWYQVILNEWQGSTHTLYAMLDCKGEFCSSQTVKGNYYFIRNTKGIFAVTSRRASKNGNFDLTVISYPVAPNSECTGAIPLSTDIDLLDQTSLYSGGIDRIFFAECNVGLLKATPNMYYSFTASKNSTYQFQLEYYKKNGNTLGLFEQGYFHIYGGSCDKPFPVMCEYIDAKLPPYVKVVWLPLTAGQQVFLMTYFDAPATFNLTVRDVGIPNDSCETAERIYTGDQVVISPPKRFGEYNPKFDYCGAGKYNLSDYNIAYYTFTPFLYGVYVFSIDEDLVEGIGIYTDSCSDPKCIPLNDYNYGNFLVELQPGQTVNVVRFTKNEYSAFAVNWLEPPKNYQCEHPIKIPTAVSVPSLTTNASSNHVYHTPCNTTITPPKGRTTPPLLFYSFRAEHPYRHFFKCVPLDVDVYGSCWVALYRGECDDPVLVDQACPVGGGVDEATVVLDRKETILFTVQFVDTDSKEGSKHPTMMGQTGAFEIFVYHETPPDLLSFIFYAGIVTVAVLAIIVLFFVRANRRSFERVSEDQ